jgi:DNA polymerase III subunit gamma/tau
MTLYLKYRPQTIDDLDLKSVRESLKNTLSQKDIPHAYLFAGPKGTGKTSAARIVAKALNCESREKSIEPCNECSTCLSITRGENMDVIEIDAASHRGIDDIRMLREAVKLSPLSLKKKVYIIDEAHMLTTEACSALLKILEEPPSHVVFILATTNPEKLIDTIRSRTTLIQFTKATEEDVVRRLEKIVKGEEVSVEPEILELIAHGADGAFRDGVKLFEQLLGENVPLTKESVSEFLFGKKSFDPELFIQKLSTHDAQNALQLIEHGIENGVSAKTIAKGILDVLRKRLIGDSKDKKEVVELVEIFSKAYAEIPSAYLEQLPLEIAVVKWCTENSSSSTAHRSSPEKKIEQEENDQGKKVETAPVKEAVEQRTESREQSTEKPKEEKVERKRLTKDTDAVITNSEVFPDATWVKVLSEIRPQNAATEALLRACTPILFDGKLLTIGVFYKFHKERLEAHPHRDLLESTLESLLGSRIRIACTLTEPPLKKVEEEVRGNNEVILTEAKNDDTIVNIAKDIFGG